MSIRIYRDNQDVIEESLVLKFTLTYNGQLKTSSKQAVSQKAAIRRHFNEQLKRLWDSNSLLVNWLIRESVGESTEFFPAKDWLRKRTNKLGKYNFIPLVTESLEVECAIEFKVLRATHKVNGIIDIDNQLKILCDSLKIPAEAQHMGDCWDSSGQEDFYVVASDDRFFTKIIATNDEILEPLVEGKPISSNDLRIMIDVYIRPRAPTQNNILFFSQNDPIWDMKFSEGVASEAHKLTDSQLRSAATQCSFRLMALDASEALNPAIPWQGDYQKYNDMIESRKKAVMDLWDSQLHPLAKSLKDELGRRILKRGQEQPEFDNVFIGNNINSGFLTGMHGWRYAALELNEYIGAFSR